MLGVRSRAERHRSPPDAVASWDGTTPERRRGSHSCTRTAPRQYLPGTEQHRRGSDAAPAPASYHETTGQIPKQRLIPTRALFSPSPWRPSQQARVVDLGMGSAGSRGHDQVPAAWVRLGGIQLDVTGDANPGRSWVGDYLGASDSVRPNGDRVEVSGGGDTVSLLAAGPQGPDPEDPEEPADYYQRPGRNCIRLDHEILPSRRPEPPALVTALHLGTLTAPMTRVAGDQAVKQHIECIYFMVQVCVEGGMAGWGAAPGEVAARPGVVDRVPGRVNSDCSMRVHSDNWKMADRSKAGHGALELGSGVERLGSRHLMSAESGANTC